MRRRNHGLIAAALLAATLLTIAPSALAGPALPVLADGEELSSQDSRLADLWSKLNQRWRTLLAEVLDGGEAPAGPAQKSGGLSGDGSGDDSDSSSDPDGEFGRIIDPSG